MCEGVRVIHETCSKGKTRYLPNTKLRVIDNVIGHGELGLVLRGVHRLNLPNQAALSHQYAAVVLRHVRQERHHQRILTLYLSQPFGQPHHALPIVPVPGQERHISPGRPRRRHGLGYSRPGDGGGDDIGCHM